MTDRISALKNLLTRLVDSRDGYADALEHIESPRIRTVLSDLHARRERNASELRSYLSRAGESVDEDGSLLAAAHRTFTDLKDSLTGTDDEAVLEEIIRGEETLHDAYDKAIEAESGHDPEYAFLVEQHASLKDAIADLKARESRAA